jgi:hypothetical protein
MAKKASELLNFARFLGIEVNKAAKVKDMTRTELEAFLKSERARIKRKCPNWDYVIPRRVFTRPGTEGGGLARP